MLTGAPPRARRRRLALGFALALALALVAAWLVAARVGHWLMAPDPLAPARAIVVLSGHLPFRAMEAAALHREGWAPEVWITVGAPRAEQAALARLGIELESESALSRLVLERLGVPPPAARMLGEPIINTVDEVRVIARELARTGGSRVIIVTSSGHVRRVRATWRALVGPTPEAIVRAAAGDPFDPGRWWRTTSDALTVVREVLGLLNVWAGFPLAPAGAADRGDQARAPRERAASP